MADDFDRTAWGEYIRQIQRRPGWSVARLVRETGIAKSTFFDWKNAKSTKAVTIPYILIVARAVGDDPIDAFKAAAGLTTNEPEDAEIALVLNATGLTDEMKDDIIAGILVQRQRHRELRTEDTIRIIGIAGGQVAS